MIKKVAGEVWKQTMFDGHKSLTKKYAVSSLGRAASFTKNVLEDGKLLIGSITSGYNTINMHLETGNITIYIHREVAKNFCKKKSPKYKYVIHKNHKKNDNKASNLQWTTLEEMSAHQQKSPKKIAFKKLQANKSVGLKLNQQQVKAIKDQLDNPKRKLTIKKIAEKYKVSEMSIYRIKSGESWSHIK
jgi:predicted DNA binding CopG/RHH family protein